MLLGSAGTVSFGENFSKTVLNLSNCNIIDAAYRESPAAAMDLTLAVPKDLLGGSWNLAYLGLETAEGS
jgi:hypothetical protein